MLTGRDSWLLTFLVLVLLVAAPRGGEGADRAQSPDLPPHVEFCKQLKTILAAAGDGFSALRTTRDAARDSVWKASVGLAGGNDCRVYAGDPAAYLCTLYSGDREGDSDTAYNQAVHRLKKCLPAGWSAQEKVTGSRIQTRATGKAGGPVVRVVSEVEQGEGYLVEFWVDVAGK